MTRHAHLKQHIRARMAKTGERYATARRQILAQQDHLSADPQREPVFHVPGNIPALSALRALLAHAAIPAPHTGLPWSEALLFGIAGGIGIGVFSFYYAKEDIATFFVGGRHLWYDDRAYLVAALDRLGVAALVQEAGGAKAADTQLRAALAAHGPAIAWVDSGALPYRGMPTTLSGSGYHVITVYQIDDQTGTALIGDLSDDPMAIPLNVLAQARARIKKDRQRILSVTAHNDSPPLERLVWAGLQACYDDLRDPKLPGAAGNVRIEALKIWADRMAGSMAKERWERVYRPGANFLRGLCAIHDFVEYHGSGGGLCRPLFADFLAEAAVALEYPPLAALGERYTALGRDWSVLADAALPDDVALLREAKELLAQKAALLHAGGPLEDIRAAWTRLGELERHAGADFPLSDSACGELRAALHERILALYHAESAAQEAIATLLARRA